MHLKAYQSQGQLDEAFGPVVSVLVLGCFALDSEQDVFGGHDRLLHRRTRVRCRNVGVGDIATTVNVLKVLVKQLQSRLDLDVA